MGIPRTEMPTMKTRPSLLALVSLASFAASASPASLVLVGCSGTDATSSVHASEATDSREAALTASGLVGTWAFAVAASDVAAPLRERCDRDSGGDAKKSAACFEAIRAEASHEKIRFAGSSGSGAGRTLRWTSFEQEAGAETVFLEAPLELVADGPGRFVATPAGPATGPMAAKLGPHVRMPIHLVDAHTLALEDPKKGRLVYVKE